MDAFDIFQLKQQYEQQQPDTTQRSIVAAARERLKGITTTLDVIRVPVERGITVFSREQALDGPQEWDKSSYVVTFRRAHAAAEWEVESIN